MIDCGDIGSAADRHSSSNADDGGRLVRSDVVNGSAPRPGPGEKDRSGAIERLEIPVLKRRLVDVFSAGYLTVIAIIQGVAFGILLMSADHAWLQHTSATARIIVVSQAVAALAAIIVVTHQYLILTAIVRWTPTALDTAIPYALGVGEIGASLLVGSDVLWWSSVAVLFLVSIGAFWYSRIRANEKVFGDHLDFHDQFHDSLLLQILACAASLLLCAAIAALSYYRLGPPSIYAATPWFVTAGGVTVEVLGDRDQDDVFVSNEIPWWTFSRSRGLSSRRSRQSLRSTSETNPLP